MVAHGRQIPEDSPSTRADRSRHEHVTTDEPDESANRHLRPRTNAGRAFAPIEQLDVSAYRIPTATPESDGTFAWDATTLVIVDLVAGGTHGLGYTYADTATARLIQDILAGVVVGRDPMDVPGSWLAMVRAIRNLGRPGIVSMAISAVDTALWDMKAKLLEVPLATLLGQVRDRVPIYGSGGFTSYSIPELQGQLSGWIDDGLNMVKMKVGRDPSTDPDRVRAARTAIGSDPLLFVDGNGAYSRKQALGLAREFANLDVRWFEEPVSSDDLDGLRLIRDAGPPGMAIAAGEYGYDLPYFRRMLAAGSVDVLQADVTRCAGISEFLRVGALCWAHSMPLSSHCAPALHVALGCALPAVCHLEYFFDHVRIEQLLFDGAARPASGCLRPDLTRLGLGLEFKYADAAQWQVGI